MEEEAPPFAVNDTPVAALQAALQNRTKVGEKEERWGRGVGNKAPHSCAVFYFFPAVESHLAARRLPTLPSQAQTGLNKQTVRPAESTRHPAMERRCCETTSDNKPLVCNLCIHIYCASPLSSPVFTKRAIMSALSASQSAGRTRAKCHFTEPLQHSTTTALKISLN